MSIVQSEMEVLSNLEECSRIYSLTINKMHIEGGRKNVSLRRFSLLKRTAMETGKMYRELSLLREERKEKVISRSNSVDSAFDEDEITLDASPEDEFDEDLSFEYDDDGDAEVYHGVDENFLVDDYAQNKGDDQQYTMPSAGYTLDFCGAEEDDEDEDEGIVSDEVELVSYNFIKSSDKKNLSHHTRDSDSLLLERFQSLHVS